MVAVVKFGTPRSSKEGNRVLPPNVPTLRRDASVTVVMAVVTCPPSNAIRRSRTPPAAASDPRQVTFKGQVLRKAVSHQIR